LNTKRLILTSGMLLVDTWTFFQKKKLRSDTITIHYRQ